jgi:calcineurin-like phosphoesterase family protein
MIVLNKNLNPFIMKFKRFAFLIILLLILIPSRSGGEDNSGKKSVRFGICTDVHKDIMFDADERLTVFIKAASTSGLDFIIQLGDFCRPYEYNLGFLKIWNEFPGEKHHVLGNHETDGGFTREESIKFLGSPAKYYSFDKNGYHFIVLDGNELNPSPDKGQGYPRYIGEEQRNWLMNDLKSTKNHVIIFSHQSLEGEGIENREQIRKILENENTSAGYKKVIACFSGHHHTDYATAINGINYIQINSMSYSWVGEKYEKIRYSNEIDAKFPWIKYTIPYKDPLYAFVEIKKDDLTITGTESTFVGPGPDELGIPERPDNDKIIPVISDRKIRY